ncbi:MAG: FABP family protein [Arachnia sp.]
MHIDVEVPEGLDPRLTALGWLVGAWEGTGNGVDHNGREFAYQQRLEFRHNGQDYLYYAAQAHELDDDGQPSTPMGMETGFWRPKPDATLEVLLAHSDGWTELLIGNIKVIQIDLRSDAVARAEGALVPHSAGQRLYGKVEGDLMYALDRATSEHELRPHLWARLTKQP